MAVVDRADPRHHPHRHRATSATSGSTSRARSLRILLPLCLVFAVVLISQGVDPEPRRAATRSTRRRSTPIDAAITEQRIPGGPFASQEAIKELGTNGGGFYNANSAHPFENPNGITNILEICALLLIPFVARRRVRRPRQGQAPGAGADRRDGGDPRRCSAALRDVRRAERQPAAHRARRRPVDLDRRSRAATWRARRCASAHAACGLFAGATTGTSTGAVNCMHDSFTPLGGAVADDAA